jgi:arylsulfatase A-like enzyme
MKGGAEARWVDENMADTFLVRAQDYILAHKDEPFFIAVGFVRPHVPFVAPKKYFKDYPFEDIVMPEVIEGDWDDIPKRGINYVTSVNGQMYEEDEKKAVAAYYAAVAYMDAQVGKVLNTLEEEGLSDKTIVVFTSDHGFHLGEHKFWMKVSLHEESVKIPLVIKVPGRKYAVGRRQSAVCSSFVELIDLYPTLAELAGLEYSEHLQGKSLVETLIEPKTQVRDMVFTVSQGGRTFGLRTDQYAYIQYDEDAGSGIELFDMVKDPKQYTNLAINPDYADLVTEFQNKLKDKLQEVRTNDLAH